EGEGTASPLPLGEGSGVRDSRPPHARSPHSYPPRKKIGAWGTLAVMSFYATKMLATGQGGMVVGSDRRLMARIRDLVGYDNRKDYKVRYNYPMSALQAAIGREQLARLDGFVQKRRSIAERYEWTLGGLPVLLPSDAPNAGEHIYFRYVLRLLEGSDRFIRHAQKRGVEVKRPVFRPLHRYLGLPANRFAGTENVFRSAVSIPLYPSLSDADVRKTGAVVRGFFDK
ncbi:MAG: DegT/DnrJ/EryC1/StrS family aminotransferase, partial [Planctomycetota bacterium]|nr:DegT/DnrJ/EryC1/StrS family aminotransferase [Planctomycetota bacterium]